jgi:cyclohexadienyl dehydratase
MHEVAHWKWIHQIPIEDAAREQALLAQVQGEARARGLDTVRVGAFFRLQIEAAKRLQKADFARWQAGEAIPSRQPRPLDELRIEIEELNRAFLMALGRAARSPLRVATTGDYKPFSFLDPVSGQYSGIDIDMARSLAGALHLDLKLVATSWPTLMEDLAAARFDVAMSGITVTEARRKLGTFSSPYVRDGKGAIVRCKDRKRFPDLAAIDRPGVRVIVNPGGTNQAFVDANIRRATIIVFADNTKIFDELVAARADAMITDRIEIALQSKLHPELCATAGNLTEEEKAYLLPRDSDLVFLVDAWLEQARDRPTNLRSSSRLRGHQRPHFCGDSAPNGSRP